MNYSRLKTNLRLAINRLKLLERKKTELAQQARREIAQYLADGKDERARIRVEHIIREDYVVEAMEMLEMYCDLLLARFGLLEHIKTMDEGLEESITSLIWASPRLQSEVNELKVIVEQFEAKFGKQYCNSAKDNAFGTVNQKLMKKLSVQAPKQVLVEQYLVEIAKNFNVPYEPDPRLMQEAAGSSTLIELGGGAGGSNNDGGASNGGGGGGGGMGMLNLNPQIGGEPQGSPFSSPHHRPPGGGGGAGRGGAGGGGGGSATGLITAGGYSSSIYPTPSAYTLPPHQTTNLDDDGVMQEKPRAFDENIVKSAGMSMPTAPSYQNYPPGQQPHFDAAGASKQQPYVNTDDMDEFNLPDVPVDFPNVPGSGSGNGGGMTSSSNNKNPNETIDVNDLARRFENLRKK